MSKLRGFFEVVSLASTDLPVVMQLLHSSGEALIGCVISFRKFLLNDTHQNSYMH